MTVNKKIQIADYNTIRSKAVEIMGAGSGSRGYGQAIYSNTVGEGQKITPNEWANLAKDIINIYKHQNGTNPNLASVVANELIRSDADSTEFVVSGSSGNTLTVTAVNSGMLAVGQTVTGPGIPLNTKIVASATTPTDPWGPGDWLLSNSVTVAAGTTLTANNTAEYPYLQFDRFFDGSRADDLVNNRFKVDISQRIAEDKTSNSITFGVGQTFTAWNTTLSVTVDFTFTSASQARYFFNSGSTISVGATRAGGDLTSQNQSWTDILASAGDRSFGAIIPQTSLTPMNGKNYYTLTSTFQEWYSISGSSPYGSNAFKIYARSPNVADNSNGTAATVQFKLEWIDNYTDPSPGNPPAPADLVNGTFTVNPKVVRAYGVLEPANFGNFTIESPTVTFGSWVSGFTPN